MSERHLFPELRLRLVTSRSLLPSLFPIPIGKDIEKANSGHLPSSECFHPLSQDPQGSQALRGDYTAEDVGVKVDRPAVEEFTEVIGA
ncbi:hypothetical protein Bca52824_088028 [Brassica carinata]|uniref:Uncharacterized protein n=1 Tax=Brassica carinata TaxID=52824 RepID=A0A8X7TNA9_BRACI|nr:hypothetical protein Bca52824_088028 [Brassica carinata]